MSSISWWILMLVLFLKRGVLGGSVAEQVNFQISEIREPTRKEQQVDMMEYDQEESSKNDSDAEPELSPSEIVETHVLPEESTIDELNIQVKTPRKRRRRRRRKRPKLTVQPDDTEPYHIIPEEEPKRKPIKYRTVEIHSDNMQETSTIPRRRNQKRRRRPLKIPVNYAEPAEELLEFASSTQKQYQDYSPNEQNIHEQSSVQPDIEYSPDTNFEHSRYPMLPSQPFSDKDEKEEIPSEEIVKFAKLSVNERHKPTKFPPPKESNVELSSAESSTIKSHFYEERTNILSTHKGQNAILPSNPEINLDFQKQENNSQKTVHENFKNKMDANRKVGFKFHRLPPTSAILRHINNRPSKDTSTTTSMKIETQKPTDENVINEISYINDTKPIKTLGEDKNPSQPYRPYFTFPLITTTAPVLYSQPISTTITLPTLASTLVTPSPAFIYISCNETINKALKTKFNLTTGENLTLTASKFHDILYNHSGALITETTSSTDSKIEEETLNALKTVALSELERLLQQVKSETMVQVNKIQDKSLNTDLNQTQFTVTEHQDSGVTESEEIVIKGPTPLNLLESQTNTERNREGKMFQQDDRNIRKNAENISGFTKELILTYTSTLHPNLTYDDIDADQNFIHEAELSLYLRNNSFHKKILQESWMHRGKNSVERKKLPLAVKSAIIISGAILALAVLGFFALLLSCKIRQAKSRMKCHRELYREHFQNSEFRQSSRSTSPVVAKSTYNGKTFSNDIQSNVASNRNYFL